MPAARLQVSISNLRDMDETLGTSNFEEPNDYHRDIIGPLVGSIGALLDQLEV